MHLQPSWAPGHPEDLPQCPGCLQKTKQPETALSAKTRLWPGPSVDARGGPGLDAPKPAPAAGFQPPQEMQWQGTMENRPQRQLWG